LSRVPQAVLPDIAGNPVELKQSNRKWGLLLLLSLGFTAGGIWMLTDGVSSGWLVAGFFGLCALISVGVLLRPVCLVLSPDGFTVKGVGKARALRWADIEEFFPAAVGATTQVAWTFRASHADHAAIRRLNRMIGLPEAALGDTFGMTAEELADVMNAWRQRYETSTSTRALA
jgi:hypothetical protein